MQKKKRNKIIILISILVVLTLLLILAPNIIKLANKNKVGLLENTENEANLVEPNVPVISAGMIPVKANGESFVITTKEDTDWYNYKEGKPAYMMLNDGYYRSELERGVKDEQLMQNNVGNDALAVPGISNNNPTILMWIPRFAYNKDGDIQYIKNTESAEDGWTIPEMFAYRQAETMPDFLLTGVWVEIKVNTNLNATITEMNSEDGKYGFLANTKALACDQTTANEIQKYIENTVGVARYATRPANNRPNQSKQNNTKNNKPKQSRTNKSKGSIQQRYRTNRNTSNI